jgi:hypothetical protein
LGNEGEEKSETEDDKSDDGWTLTTKADPGKAKRKTVVGIKVSRPKKTKRVMRRNSVTNARGETIFTNETRLITDEPMAVVHLPGGPIGVYEQKAKMFGVLGLFHEYLDELDDCVDANNDFFEHAGSLGLDDALFNFTKVFMKMVNSNKQNLSPKEKREAIVLLQKVMEGYQGTLGDVDTIWSKDAWMDRDVLERMASYKKMTLKSLKKELKEYIIGNLTSFSTAVKKVIQAERPLSADQTSTYDEVKVQAQTKKFDFDTINTFKGMNPDEKQ